MAIDKGGGSDGPDDPDDPDKPPDRSKWESDHQARLDRIRKIEASMGTREDDAARVQAALESRGRNKDAGMDQSSPPAPDRDEGAKSDRMQETKAALEDLPKRGEGDKTRGAWIDSDGNRHELVSGNDDYKKWADQVVAESGMLTPGRRLAITSHVEVKFAMMMSEKGLTDESLAVNQQPCKGQLGCDERLGMFLPAGGRLTVYGPDQFSKTYEAREEESDCG